MEVALPLAQPQLRPDQLLNKPAQLRPRRILLLEQIKLHRRLRQHNSNKALPGPDCLDKWPVLLRMVALHLLPQIYTNLKDSGVAVGSSIGHAIGGFFGGGSSQPAAEQQQDNSVASQTNAQQSNNWGTRSCEVDAKQFTKCMDENQGNMQICGWYLEQLVGYPCFRTVWKINTNKICV